MKLDNPNERKTYEAYSAIPKPIALPQELQTKPYPPNQAGEGNLRVPPDALWSETTNQARPVAQKQSPRLISERTRSVTARDDQISISELANK